MQEFAQLVWVMSGWFGFVLFSYVAVICVLSFCSSNTFPLLGTKIL